ncbi:MAG: hypothetical protein K0U39_03750 [Alphaproteobacteria bacterium]|nr:hypothetical protein [Alphaproteobacteria bacterium]
MGKPSEGEKREYRKKVKPLLLKEYSGDKGAWKQALKRAWDTRQFEIELSWKRTNYFSIMVGALFIGYYSIIVKENGKNEELLAILIALLGFCASLAWFFVNKGSKFWQEKWEIDIDCIEAITKDNKLHSNIFGYHNKHKQIGLTSAYPFSVSKINMVFSAIVTVAWFCIYVISVWNFSQKDIIDSMKLQECDFWIKLQEYSFWMKFQDIMDSMKLQEYDSLIVFVLFIILLVGCFEIIRSLGKSSFADEQKPLAGDNPNIKEKIYYYDEETKKTGFLRWVFFIMVKVLRVFVLRVLAVLCYGVIVLRIVVIALLISLVLYYIEKSLPITTPKTQTTPTMPHTHTILPSSD